MSDEQQAQQADDPSGDGWRDVGDREPLQSGDMYEADNYWRETNNVGGLAYGHGIRYRRRIEPQQPSDSEPVNAELQQLREQVATLTANWDSTKAQLWDAVEARQKAERELKDKGDSYQICLQSHWKAGRRSAIDKLQTWLRPVLEVVADHPDHSSILAASVLEFLPQIASRLIEE